VTLIENKKNTGFSVANNQAIKLSKGEFVLLLNPDTVVQEDTFEKVIAFMESHQNAGGLGVKMVDGKGNFLPESKRGLPTPKVAFYKIFGLAKLFPGSKKFGQYHLTYLDKDKTNEIDVLSGAFMLLRKSALDKTGLLDETFFMYGEDIDLSYRLQLAGYKNYYFPETCIIHYKGESTKKSSVNYVFVFYRAMIIFARKHFSKNNAGLFAFLINIAIYLRASIAITGRFIKQFAVPFMDYVLTLGGLYLIRFFYEKKVRFIDGGSYEENLVNIAFPAYALIWVFSVFINGGYDKPINIKKIARGVLVGTGLILIAYSLLPETYRFSRALILYPALATMLLYLLSRTIFHFLNIKNYRLAGEKTKRIAIIGNKEEFARVSGLLKQTAATSTEFIGFVSADSNGQQHPNYIGNISQTDEVIEIYKINEVIFCARDLSSQEIIGYMLKLVSSNVDFKIAPPESFSIIGSNSIETAGDLYVIDINSITRPRNRRNKRMLDMGISIFFLSFFILIFWKVKNKGKFFLNIFSVLFAFKSWVGYSGDDHFDLPKIKKAALSPADAYPEKTKEPGVIKKLNLLYSKDYKIEKDLKIIWKGFEKLGG
ncbi:MAG: glycosyltransferase, partial [Bacteroidia bacterium]|nr:glycosyltransferase [Bacteroidia bacterium]